MGGCGLKFRGGRRARGGGGKSLQVPCHRLRDLPKVVNDVEYRTVVLLLDSIVGVVIDIELSKKI